MTQRTMWLNANILAFVVVVVACKLLSDIFSETNWQILMKVVRNVPYDILHNKCVSVFDPVKNMDAIFIMKHRGKAIC